MRSDEYSASTETHAHRHLLRYRGRLKVPLAVGSAALLAMSMLNQPTWAISSAADGGGDGDDVVSNAAAACPALSRATIPAAKIGLPTRGAVVTSATLKAADPAAGASEFCLVKGHVTSVDPSAPPVNFEVNLPTNWNRRTLQFGGGGFDGTVVTGLGIFGWGTAPGQAAPLDLGYVTFGSDGGASVGSNPPSSFALNPTAFSNYSGEAVKRTRDTAVAITKQYYRHSPRYQYFAGGSKGGQEALTAAERYSDDYNGIIAYFPASQQAFLWSAYHLQQVAYGTPGAYLDPAKQQMFGKALFGACDKLDKAADGVISNVSACEKAFTFTALRCPGGRDTGDTCLSDAQIATLKSGQRPYKFDFPFPNGTTTVGGYPILAGGKLSPYWLDTTGKGTETIFNGLTMPAFNYWYQQRKTPPPALDLSLDYKQYKNRIHSIGTEYDRNNPNMDQFVTHGGKLILVQGNADMLTPPNATNAYYKSVAARYGKKTQQFMRYYTVPGYGHGEGVFNLAWDSVSALDSWVTKGTPPNHPIAYNGSSTTVQSRPLCQYPSWPKYNGHGNANEANSFSCVTS